MIIPPEDTHFAEDCFEQYQRVQYLAARKHARGGVAVDCGAHIGIMTRRMADDFEKVYAFEPVWGDILRYNTQDKHNVTVISSALSNQPGISTMSVNAENSGDNRLGAGTREVCVQTIDEYGLDDVAMIKMDIQGSEYPALVGARETIQRSHPVLLIETERWDKNAERIKELLTDWGYTAVYTKNADTVYVWRG